MSDTDVQDVGHLNTINLQMLAGYLLSFVFVVLLAAGIFLFGYASRRASTLYVVALEVILGWVLITPVILFTDVLSFSELFTKPSKENWLWLGAAAIVGFIGGNFFSVINLRTGRERMNSLLSPAITACAVLAAGLVFQEQITLVKAIGIIVTLTAIIIFLHYRTKNAARPVQANTALWSGAATVLCITFTIIFSIKGTQHTQLSIMHSVWLRLLVALPFVLMIFLTQPSLAANSLLKLYGAITAGVIAQTIIASYLWFYCTYKVGISAFQVIIATLPFFVYAADVYLFNKTKRSAYFLITAFVALLGIWLVMW
jgi:drug/metabolite transporter (DMT)-like permease